MFDSIGMKPHPRRANALSALLSAALLAALTACSSSDTPPSTHYTPQSCATDSDCPAGQGCRKNSAEKYCSTLCILDSECPTPEACAGDTEAPARECKENAGHTDDKGVCNLFNSNQGPNTCQ